MPAPRKPRPRWQSITALPLIAAMIDGQLEATEEQYQTLLPARDRPGALDDPTIERVVRVFTKQVELLGVNQQQLDRWRTGPLTAAQRQEVERLGRQVTRTRQLAAAILALAEELKATTIDAILGKGDLELGLELLAGRSPLFPQSRESRPTA